MLKFESPALRAGIVNGGKKCFSFRMVLLYIIIGRIKKIVKSFFLYFIVWINSVSTDVFQIYLYTVRTCRRRIVFIALVVLLNLCYQVNACCDPKNHLLWDTTSYYRVLILGLPMLASKTTQVIWRSLHLGTVSSYAFLHLLRNTIVYLTSLYLIDIHIDSDFFLFKAML